MTFVAGRAGTINARRYRKYRNQPTSVADHDFASKSEAKRYEELLLLERNGEVRDIRLQVPYRLEFNGILICKYVADFVYNELRKGVWSEVVEDRKGYRTPIYRLKKKMMKVIKGIEIRET